MVTNDRSLTRRSTLKIAGAGAFAAVLIRTGTLEAFAQDSTPMAGGQAFAGMGLPELNVSISDTGYEGLEAQLTAGMYLVHATYTGSQSGNLVFMQLPEGMTSSDLMSMLGGDQASPAAEGEDEGGAEPPDWFYSTYIAGGAGVGPNQTAHFVLDFQPGNYIAWGEDPSAPQAPVDITVSGDMASPMADMGMMPQAEVTISEIATESGFAFQVEGDLTGSAQVVAVTNNSDQPHFVEFDLLPAGATKDDVDALFQSFMSGTPATGGLSEDDIQPVYLVGTQSAGVTQWHDIALAAGNYLVSCWIPDYTRGGIPHAMEGMYDVVSVGGGAMATPSS
jgi:hypothetical protein